MELNKSKSKKYILSGYFDATHADFETVETLLSQRLMVNSAQIIAEVGSLHESDDLHNEDSVEYQVNIEVIRKVYDNEA